MSVKLKIYFLNFDTIMKESEFTKEQIEELIQWFRDHWKSVPESVVLDDATSIPNLRDTLPKLIECVKLSWYKYYFRGYVHTLYKIKEKIK